MVSDDHMDYLELWGFICYEGLKYTCVILPRHKLADVLHVYTLRKIRNFAISVFAILEFYCIWKTTVFMKCIRS